MKSEDDPLDDGEAVLRRIPAAYYKADLPVPVAPEAFRPSSQDEYGLSVFREACLATPADCLKVIPDEEKRKSFRIARLRVTDLTRLGLTLKPDPRPDVPGHMLIPELNLSSYNAKKARWKPIQFELAKLASRDIVYPLDG